jgi:hypothetical protein
MTPLFKKEGKVILCNTITFSSSMRRSTLAEAPGGGGVFFKQYQINYLRILVNNL